MKILPWLALLPFAAWIIWACRVELDELNNEVVVIFAIIGKVVTAVGSAAGILGLLAWGAYHLGWFPP